MKKRAKRRFYRPYLAAYLSVGFMGLRADVMQQAVGRYTHDYIYLEWWVLKWRGKFNLYRPGRDL